MSHPSFIPLFVTILLLPQVFVQGGFLRELGRKFFGFFTFSKSSQPGPFYDNCNLCSYGPCTPMVWPSKDENFNAIADAETIMDILITTDKNKNLNEDEKATFANILTKRSAPQRTAIAEAFQKECGKRIIDKLSERMSDGFRYHMLIKALSLPLPQFVHFQFELAIQFQEKSEFYQNLGQTIIVEMLTTLPKCLMNKAIESYNSIAGRELISDLDKALTTVGKPPEYREVIKKLVEQKREPSQHASWIKALFDAYKLKSAVISRRDAELKERFSELFTKCSIPQIIETIEVYENLRHGEKEFISLFTDIGKYTGGEKEIYTIMVRLLKSKPLYYAKIIEYILKSGKTGDVFEERLIYLIAGRYDIDLRDIVIAYNQQSKTGLRADFEAWDISDWAVSFHDVMVNIILKALKTR